MREEEICRICYAGGSRQGEGLISTCRCTGSVGKVHRSCLEDWLSFSKKRKCDICKFPYLIRIVSGGWAEFWTMSGDRVKVTCCLLTWIVLSYCIFAFEKWIEQLDERYHLLILYIAFCQFTVMYLTDVWCDWTTNHRRLTIICPEPRDLRRQKVQFCCCVCCEVSISRRPRGKVCLCTGPIAMVHGGCTETLYNTLTGCEQCQSRYEWKLVYPTWREFLTASENRVQVGHIIMDLVCWLILSVLMGVSMAICVLGAVHYEKVGWWGQWGGSLVVALDILLIIMHLIWCSCKLVHHVDVWDRWIRAHPRIFMQSRWAAQWKRL